MDWDISERASHMSRSSKTAHPASARGKQKLASMSLPKDFTCPTSSTFNCLVQPPTNSPERSDGTSGESAPVPTWPPTVGGQSNLGAKSGEGRDVRWCVHQNSSKVKRQSANQDPGHNALFPQLARPGDLLTPPAQIPTEVHGPRCKGRLEYICRTLLRARTAHESASRTGNQAQRDSL